jgi:hypothetical protein
MKKSILLTILVLFSLSILGPVLASKNDTIPTSEQIIASIKANNDLKSTSENIKKEVYRLLETETVLCDYVRAIYRKNKDLNRDKLSNILDQVYHIDKEYKTLYDNLKTKYELDNSQIYESFHIYAYRLGKLIEKPKVSSEEQNKQKLLATLLDFKEEK